MPSHLQRRCFLFLLAAALAMPGQLCGQSATVTYPVQGVVLNSLTREPIVRALVEEGSTAMLTDSQGHFELDLPQGVQQLTVRRPGYRHTNQNHAVFVGPNMPELTFELTPQITVSGEIILSSGEPADSVQIQVFRKSIVDNNREKWLPVQNANTNTAGTFHIAALERGGNYVFCTEPAFDDTSAPPIGSKTIPASRFGYPSSCYPGPLPALTGLSSDRNLANTLTFTAGQHTEIEIPLTREPFYHVMIPVLNIARWPGAEIQIHAAGNQEVNFPAEWKSAMGYAEAYLPNGQYYAEAMDTEGMARGESSAYGRVDFRVANKPLIGPGITLLALHPIPIEIHKDFTIADDAKSTALKRNSSDDPGVGLALVPADEGTGNGNMNQSLTHSRGASDTTLYQLGSASPGRYWVESFPTQGYVSTISSGGVDLTRQPLVIGPGSAAAPILVNLRNDVGRIQVTIHTEDGAPTPSINGTVPGELHTFFVYAFPMNRILWQTPLAAGQAADPVAIEGLAPGQYCVVAFDRAQEFNLNDPEAIARIASLGQTVNVTAGGTANVQLNVVHATGEEPQFISLED